MLTREAGKNGKLQAMLAARGVRALELPLVETAPGPDRDALPGVLRAGGFDWAVITSPEAAAVFLEGWRAAGCPQARCQACLRHRVSRTAVLACDCAAACGHRASLVLAQAPAPAHMARRERAADGGCTGRCA